MTAAADESTAGRTEEATLSRRPFVVGLTGGIGSGKSTVADLFAARGASIVDTDEIAHELTAAGGAAIDAIRARFGDTVLRADGALDRDAMRARAFDDPSAREALEAILHPMIRAESQRRIAAARGPYVMHVVPLLVESAGRSGRFDRVLVVDCPVPVQIARVQRRSGLSLERIKSILAAQASREARLAAADDVIDNGGDADALPAQVDALHRRYAAAR
ncbi:MAG: dephospho-CoA kinase [Burkholderiaceae bacterium]|jgi:dephospho-CoA kinase|nr:dephospho-CoA kinase [Burkholderiaceae bacterium]